MLVFIVGKSNGACITGYQEVPFTTYFVIIGTYQEELNAIKHVRQARFFIESTDYFFNTIKNSYYVFAFKSDDKHTTLNKLHELRVDPYFREAWYYKHQFDRFPGSQPPMVKNERKTIQNPYPKLQKKRPAVKVEDPAPAIDHASLLPIIGQIAEEQDNPSISFTDSGQDTVTSVNKTLTNQNPIEQMERTYRHLKLFKNNFELYLKSIVKRPIIYPAGNGSNLFISQRRSPWHVSALGPASYF